MSTDTRIVAHIFDNVNCFLKELFYSNKGQIDSYQSLLDVMGKL